MKTRIAFIATFLFAAVGLFADEAPKTPVLKALEGWVRSFNEHDLAARKEYLKTNTMLPAAQIDEYSPMDIQLREENGPLEIVKVERSSDTEIVAELRHKNSGASPTIRLEIEAAEPHRITRIGLRL